MKITKEFKDKVIEAMLNARNNYEGSDAAFAKTMSISAAIFSRLKNGETEKLLSDAEWIDKGRRLNVQLHSDNWKTARTEVYQQIEESFHHCQRTQSSMVLVDDCGIGKTHCAKIVISKMKNAFYIDGSQHKTKRSFINALANILGCNSNGKYEEVLATLKYYINMMNKPFICVDEAGDLDYSTLLELKGLWNGTNCAWFMMGAEGLRAKIDKGIRNNKVGFAEIFSRFSDEFVTLVPQGRDDRLSFYQKLISDVALPNIKSKDNLQNLISNCIATIGGTNAKEKTYKIKSLRFLKTAIQVIEA